MTTAPGPRARLRGRSPSVSPVAGTPQPRGSKEPVPACQVERPASFWCSVGRPAVLEVLAVLFPGNSGRMSYQVADGAEPHRSSTDVGAKLFIVSTEGWSEAMDA